MAENVTLARPYAEAAFQMATSGATGTAVLSSWSNALAQLATVVVDPEMRECIGNPRLDPSQLTQLCLNVLGAEAALTATLTIEQQNFVGVLVDNGRLVVLPEISQLFDELKHNHEGIKDAEIASAFPLDDATLGTLTADLERKFGCKVNATVKLDPELIGGVRIAVGDEVIDASVRGKLAAMATALKN